MITCVLSYGWPFLFYTIFIRTSLPDSYKKGSLFNDIMPVLLLIASLIIIISAVIAWSQYIKHNRIIKEKEDSIERLELVKAELELKDRNMTDSLAYAKRIQEAMLPSEYYFRKHFRESFILFRPRDIVSGDFFWIGEKNGKTFIVAADCTGHGVPGALMSVIGLEVIDKAINEEALESPAEILSRMNKALEYTFTSEKNLGTIIRDGMDIGICVIDKGKKELEFSGAFLPLYIIRGNVLMETAGDKLIIGMNSDDLPYTTHRVELKEGDIMYMFSDGYVDQFGGAENKKFMYRRFRYLLTTIHRFSVEDQKSILDENFKTWMGSNQQIDDVMVIGFKPL